MLSYSLIAFLVLLYRSITNVFTSPCLVVRERIYVPVESRDIEITYVLREASHITEPRSSATIH
jgi:hypothetical protein